MFLDSTLHEMVTLILQQSKHKKASQLFYPHGKTKIIFELLGPPSFSIWAKESGSKVRLTFLTSPNFPEGQQVAALC
jgi:hypothetical protein